MTSNARGGGRILGGLISADAKGVVRVEDRFDTDIDDLWSALTDPRRLAGWIGEVEGDQTILVVEERRRDDVKARWDELLPAYQDLAANVS
jgi:hypothetical protein